jgi:hypothetical protein
VASANEKDVQHSQARFQNRFQEASPELFKIAVEERRKVFGSADEAVADALDLVGASLIEAGRPDQAEPHLRESLAIRNQLRQVATSLLPSDTPIRLDPLGHCRTTALLGKCLFRQNKIPAAREELVKARTEIRQFDDADTEIAQAIDRLLKELDSSPPE